MQKGGARLHHRAVSATFWDRCAGVYDLVEICNRKALRQATARTAQLVPTWSSVLECAGGTGEFSLAAAEQAGSVMCTDLSPAMLARAEKKAKRRKKDNISFSVRDLTALPEADGTYDVVIAANILHLLPQPEYALRELWRVTAPGGKLILPTYLQGEAGALFKPLLNAYQYFGFRPYWKFTLGSYRSFLAEQGLPVQVSRVVGPLPIGFAVCQKTDL